MYNEQLPIQFPKELEQWSLFPEEQVPQEEMMVIYFVRHGQDTSNRDFVYQPFHTPLTEDGRKQAARAGEILREQNVYYDNLVFVSPQQRARETAVAMDLDAIQVFLPDLREREHSYVLSGVDRESEYVTTIKQEIAEGKHLGDPAYKEETKEELLERTQRALDTIFELTHGRRHIMVVSHGATIKAAVTALLYGEKTSAEDVAVVDALIELGNGAILSLVRGDNGKWQIKELINPQFNETIIS